MDDDTEVLDWSNDDDEHQEPPLSQPIGLGTQHSSGDLDDEDAVSLGDEEEDISVFQDPRDSQADDTRHILSNGDTAHQRATKMSTVNQPLSRTETEKSHNSSHRTPPKRSPGSPTRYSHSENNHNSPTPRPPTRLTHALPPKPVSSAFAFIPSHSTMVEATAMAGHAGRSSAKNSTSTPTDAENLPPPWESRRSRDNQTYYFNPVTGVSTWTIPGSPSKDGRSSSTRRRRGSSLSARDRPSSGAISDSSRQSSRIARVQPGTDAEHKDGSQSNHTELSFEDRHYRPGAADHPTDSRRNDRTKEDSDRERERDRHYAAPVARRPPSPGSPRLLRERIYERERSPSPLPPPTSLSEPQRLNRDTRISRNGNGAQRPGRSSRTTTNSDVPVTAVSKDRDRYYPADSTAQSYLMQDPQALVTEPGNKSAHEAAGSASTRLSTASSAGGRQDPDPDRDPETDRESAVRQRDASLSTASEGRERRNQHPRHQEHNISAPRRRSPSSPPLRSHRRASPSPPARALSPRLPLSQYQLPLNSQRRHDDGSDHRRPNISVSTESMARQQQQPHPDLPPTPATTTSMPSGTRSRDRRSRFGDVSVSVSAVDTTVVAAATANAAMIARKLTASASMMSVATAMEVDDDESMVPDEFLVDSHRDTRQEEIAKEEGERSKDGRREEEYRGRGREPDKYGGSMSSYQQPPVSAPLLANIVSVSMSMSSDSSADRRAAASENHHQATRSPTQLQPVPAAPPPNVPRRKREPLPPQKERFLEVSKYKTHPPSGSSHLPPPQNLSSSTSTASSSPHFDSHPPSGPREQRSVSSASASQPYPPYGSRGPPPPKIDDRDREWGRSRDGGSGRRAPPPHVERSRLRDDVPPMDVDRDQGQAMRVHPDREALIMQVGAPTAPKGRERERDREHERGWQGEVASERGSFRGRDTERRDERVAPSPISSAMNGPSDIGTYRPPVRTVPPPARYGDGYALRKSFNNSTGEGAAVQVREEQRMDSVRSSDMPTRIETSRRQPPPLPPPRISGTNSVPIGKRSASRADSPPPSANQQGDSIDDPASRRGRYRDPPPHVRGSRPPKPLIDNFRPGTDDRDERSTPPFASRERSPHRRLPSQQPPRPELWTSSPPRDTRYRGTSEESEHRAATPPPLSREPSMASLGDFDDALRLHDRPKQVEPGERYLAPSFIDGVGRFDDRGGSGPHREHSYRDLPPQVKDSRGVREYGNGHEVGLRRENWSRQDAPIGDDDRPTPVLRERGFGREMDIDGPPPDNSSRTYEQNRGLPSSLPSRPESSLRESQTGSDSRGRRWGNGRGSSQWYDNGGSRQRPPLPNPYEEVGAPSSSAPHLSPVIHPAPIPLRRERDDRLPDHLPPRPQTNLPPPSHNSERRPRSGNPSKRPPAGSSLLERLSLDKGDVPSVPPPMESPPQSLRDRVQVPSKRDRDDGLFDGPRDQQDFFDDDGNLKRRRKGGRPRRGRRPV